MILARSFLVTLALLSTSCATAALPPEAPIVPSDRGEITVYLVRHAEKALENPSDPELSTIGYARADSLGQQLREAGVNVIITTNLKRTGLTARPLALLRGITPEVVALGTVFAFPVYALALWERRKRSTLLFSVMFRLNFELKEYR